MWLYAYALGVTSSRRVEQRIREDLAFRYLAGNARPDYWALNAFRRRHGRAINDCFTQVVEMARGLGLRQLGTVAIDATRIKASASPDKVVKIERGDRARTRLKVRRWQQACDADDPNENAGSGVGAAIEAVEQVELGRDLAPLPRPGKGVLRQSATDPDARFLRARGGRFVLGYTGEIAVSEDHLIVAQRVTAQSTDNASLVPMVELVKTNCGSPPGRVVADSGYYSNHNAEQMEALGIDAYVPDSNLARELNLGHQTDDLRCHDPSLRRMREKMRSEQGRHLYRKRRAIVEPVFGSAQTTTQPARVPSALPRQGGHRVRPRCHSLQPHPHPPLPLTQTLLLTQRQALPKNPVPRLTHTIAPNPPRALTQTLQPCV